MSSGASSVRTGVVALLLAVLVSFAVACSSTGPARDAQGGAGEAYAEVLRWFVHDSGGEASTPMVFVTARGEGLSFGLATQAAVIDASASFADARFVDARSEALDDDGVRDDGIFVALGPLVEQGNTVTIDCDQILSSDTEISWRFELAADDDSWRIIGEPERIV